jgi:hypothetical protein
MNRRKPADARRSWAAAMAAALVLGCTNLVTAQAPPRDSADGLDTARRRKEVAAQKAETEVRDALRESQQLAASSVSKAVERLQGALDRLEGDTSLSEKRRESLKHLLQDRIRVAQSPSVAPEDPINKQIRKTKRKDEEDQRLTDQDRIRRLLEGIRTLRREGKTDEAEKQAGELARKNPDNPAAQAASRTTSVANQVEANRQLQGERERRVAGTIREVDRGGLPPKGDVEFPKDWKTRTKNRSVSTVKLTEKEKAIFRALNSTISIRFKDSRLEDVIEYLRTVTGLPILLDPVSMEEAQVTYDSPVSANVKGVTARFLLKKVLADLGLTYVIKDEVIEVMTPKKAQDQMVVRTYYVGDLVANRWQAADMIALIVSTIDPESWRVNGGAGTIVYHPITRSLVIKQSAEFHGVLSGGLK